jgi:protein SCO1/2
VKSEQTMNRDLKKTIQYAAGLMLALWLTGCENERLPIFGQREVSTRQVNGKQVNDTVYHTIAPFRFTNQDSSVITNEAFNGKVPVMKTQLFRVYQQVEDDEDVLILSHTIDPEYDTVGLLRDFANRLGVKSSKWHFATGQPKEYVFDLAQKSYFATAMEDKTEPDGFIHSGAFLLIDRQGRIRGKYDGTKEDDVNRLMKDIKTLERE